MNNLWKCLNVNILEKNVHITTRVDWINGPKLHPEWSVVLLVLSVHTIVNIYAMY